MAERIDFSALTRSERIVLIAGSLSVVNAMIPWWYRFPNAGGAARFNAGLRGLGVIAVGCAAAAALGVLARAWIWPSPANARDGVAYALLGTTAAISLVVQAANARAEWLGLWAGVALATLIAFGGWRRRGDRARGWI